MACGGRNPVGPDSAAGSQSATVFALRASPVDPSLVDFILPLGNLNPPSHTFPTDHIYFYVGYLRPEIGGVPVFAPGDGIISAIISHTNDSKVMVRATNTISYYVDHVVLDSAIAQGARITSGQKLGTSGSGGFGIDLGVTDDARTLTGFITPARYPFETVHAEAPLKYFEEPMRSRLYDLVRRDGADRDGRIDFDQPGRLIGNWFLETLSVSESSQPGAWTKLLAFVADNIRPSERRISVGGTLAVTGTFAVDAGTPSFADVTAASGLVRYGLSFGSSENVQGTIIGTMLVQMADGVHIRAEIVPASGGMVAQFSPAAQTYTR
jgi:hypothetical protein